MTNRFVVATALVGAFTLAGLSYGYVLLRAPSSEPLVPPAPPHISLAGFDEPVHQPKAMPLQPLDPCYAVLVLQQGRFKCFPSGRLIPPVLRNQGRATVETIHGQRRILPSPRVAVETIKSGKSTETIIK